jgi:ribonuclease HI
MARSLLCLEKLSTPVFCAISGSAEDRLALQRALQSAFLGTGMQFSPESTSLVCGNLQDMPTRNHGNLLRGRPFSRMVLSGAEKNDMCNLVAYVDGSSHGSPGPSGIGIIVEDSAGGCVRIAKSIGWQDNNVAEYVALLEALQCALDRRALSLHVYSDSEVVVRQMRGDYACRSSRLYSLHWICRKLARSLEFAITRIPRERNLEANHLANSVARQCREISTVG